MNRRNFIRMLSQSFIGAAFLPTVIDAAEPDDKRRAQFVFAQVKYRGGDWNPHPLSVTPLMEELMVRTSVEAGHGRHEVTLDRPRSCSTIRFFISPANMNSSRSAREEIEILRRFLSYGGFLLIDDALGQQGYGFDKAVRREMQRIFPGMNSSACRRAMPRCAVIISCAASAACESSVPTLEGITIGNVDAGDLLPERSRWRLGARSSRQVDQRLHARRRSAAQRRFSSGHQSDSLCHDRELQRRSDPRSVHPQAAHSVNHAGSLSDRQLCPWWLIALVGLAAAALLAQQFLSLSNGCRSGRAAFLTFLRAVRLCGLDFLFAWSGADRQARDQTAPAAHGADRQLAEHGLSGER